METLIIIWLLFGLAAGMIAGGKGRSSGGFFLLGLLFGPFGLLAAAVASPNKARNERAGLQSGRMRKCPQCAEVISSEAKICRHCRSPVDPLPKRDWMGRAVN